LTLDMLAVCGILYNLYSLSETQKCTRFLKYIDKSNLCQFLKFAFIALI